MPRIPPGPPKGGEFIPSGPPKGGESIPPAGGLGGPTSGGLGGATSGGLGGTLRESAATYHTGQLTWQHLKELEAALKRFRPQWTTETLWNAYARLHHQRPLGGPKILTNLISLVRAVVQLDDELTPYPERVQQRYADWLAAQEAAGRSFSPEQRQWLDRIAEAVGVNLRLSLADLDEEFYDDGGLFAAQRLFGEQLEPLLNELNEELVV